MRDRGLAIPEIEHIGGAAPVVKAAPLAANAHTNWDGVYTDAQVQRERDVYRRACAVCGLPSGHAGRQRRVAAARRAFVPRAIHTTNGARDGAGRLLNANGGRSGSSELPLDVAEIEKIAITEQR